jgi:hypothetical protein
MEDDSQDSHPVAQILNQVVAVVAPSNMVVSYSVLMVPCYDDDADDELVAYKVHTLIRCVDPESMSSELHAHLETVHKERGLYSTFGVGNLSKMSRKESDKFSRNHP